MVLNYVTHIFDCACIIGVFDCIIPGELTFFMKNFKMSKLCHLKWNSDGLISTGTLIRKQADISQGNKCTINSIENRKLCLWFAIKQ